MFIAGSQEVMQVLQAVGSAFPHRVSPSTRLRRLGRRASKYKPGPIYKPTGKLTPCVPGWNLDDRTYAKVAAANGWPQRN